MLITFNFKDIKLLSLQFLILLINDFLIYIIFFIWYLLYQLNIVISPNPLFAYILTLFYNLLILYFMIYKNISIDKIIIYSFIIFILKMVPIYYMITYYIIITFHHFSHTIYCMILLLYGDILP